MEENTDYTELETTEEHAEEIGTENTEESGTQDAEPAEDFPADAESVENSPVDSETEDSGNNEFSESDNLSSDTVLDTENSSSDLPSSDLENETENNADFMDTVPSTDDMTEDSLSDDGTLLERVETLINALSSEADESGESESGGSSEPEISEHDIQTLETLQAMNATLSVMQSESEAWHTETLKYREETQKTQHNIVSLLEVNALLFIGTGFFIALLCGGKFADIFFKRMREKE